MLLEHEHHTDVLDKHDLMSRFTTFAGTCGWTIDYQETEVSGWDSTNGAWIYGGEETFGMISSTGATNGNHAAQNMIYQLYSGITGSILIHGRKNTVSKDISDPANRGNHPIYQGRWGLSSTNAYRFICKADNPPDVWFFGNAHFLSIHVNNDGVRTSGFQLGSHEIFDKTLEYTDCNYMFNFHDDVQGHTYESVPESYTPYWGFPGFYTSQRDCILFAETPRYVGEIASVTLDLIWGSTYRDSGPSVYESSAQYVNSSKYKIFNEHDVSGGYKMPYSNSRILIKQLMYAKHPGTLTHFCLGQSPYYFAYVGGLSSGDIIEQGSKQFMIMGGWWSQEIGLAYRIA